MNVKCQMSNVKCSHSGFTIMEVVVATSIFALAITVMLTLFNYTLRIQRKTEALRLASQTVRNVGEFLVKEIRNGKVDYNITDGQVAVDPIDVTGVACPPKPTMSGVNAGRTYNPSGSAIVDRIGIINLEGERECVRYVFDAVTNTGKLRIQKNNLPEEDLTPPGVNVSMARFYVRPQKDPYTDLPTSGSSLVEMQPVVTILLKVTVQLPTREVYTIPYQTSVSTSTYNIPNQ